MQAVKIRVVSVGDNFGCRAIIRDARTGRRLAATRLCPHGFDGAAEGIAENICDANGWRVVDDESER